MEGQGTLGWGRVPRPQLYADTQHYGDVCLCYDPGYIQATYLLS